MFLQVGKILEGFISCGLIRLLDLVRQLQWNGHINPKFPQTYSDKFQESNLFEVKCDLPAANKLLTQMYSMQEASRFTDFTIKVGDNKLECHR